MESTTPGARLQAEPVHPAPPMTAASVPRKSATAIAALVLGILGFTLPALICGYVAKGRIDRSQGALTGRGLAVAGIACAWAWLALLVLMLVIGASSTGGTGTY